MELIPFYGERKLVVSELVVQVDPEDKKRMSALVARAQQICDGIANQEDFERATQVAAELKSASVEINASKRKAKLPFESVLNAVESLAKQFAKPIKTEYDRIQAMLDGYVAELEKQRKEVERKRREEERIAREQAERKIREAEAERRAALEQARQAKDELERERALNEASRRQLAVAQAQLQKELELEVAGLFQEPVKGLVPGGRVRHPWKFKLIDPAIVVMSGHLRLLRIELNLLNCQDAVKEQLENNPDKTPELPGIEISQPTKVDVKPAARVA